jgi:hypothetical protein
VVALKRFNDANLADGDDEDDISEVIPVAVLYGEFMRKSIFSGCWYRLVVKLFCFSELLLDEEDGVGGDGNCGISRREQCARLLFVGVVLAPENQEPGDRADEELLLV